MSDHGAAKNRLARESSPYLLLHASNPVDWYPWGEEAFAKARREDKPIFLSVGYSTCYWCHVMERQCFSSAAIAERLNQGFVSIKLDREERPDLDEVYMAATQLLTRSGGWPNSLFLTHELKPFFAGTYFPPEDSLGRPGFPRVLAAIRDAWESRRDTVLEQAEAVAGAIREQLGGGSAGAGALPGRELIDAARDLLAGRFDAVSGGFGSAPKFPSPSNLFFLLDLSQSGDEQARRMLVTTLDAMARGGIHDQLAGGFHRYSTDALWLVPHFEKMLYDNAALAALYAEAAPLAPEAGFARVARATLDFVLALLTGPHGGFLSAIDAETDGHEGAYYTWPADELSRLLDPESHELLGSVYGFDAAPNFEGQAYVLYLPRPLAEQARALGVSEAELLLRLEPGRQALLAARGQRKHPLVDDKVLCDWNGLMIGAMARAGRLLPEPRYVEAASRAGRFVLEQLAGTAPGGLLHSYRDGVAKVPAFLDDYAFLIEGLLELEAASGDPGWLQHAVRLQAEQEQRLGDGAAGGYFVAGDDEHLLFRSKAAHDGAVASGNGVAALNLIELSERTGDATYRVRAEALLSALGPALSDWPLAHVTLIRALGRIVVAESGVRVEPVSARKDADAALALVAVHARLESDVPGPWKPFSVELEVQEGWHLQANPASLPFLIPTEVRPADGQLRALRYPTGQPLRGAFADEPVSVYSGKIRIEGEVEASDRGRRVKLTYQACDDKLCLPPVTREIALC